MVLFQVISGNVIQYTLTIHKVRYSHFHMYTISLDNGMGVRQHSITLIEGEDFGR